jgi:hypothetical protein
MQKACRRLMLLTKSSSHAVKLGTVTDLIFTSSRLSYGSPDHIASNYRIVCE